jgi:hypothetical protein
MTAKARIKQLEKQGVNIGAFFEYRSFVHTIDGDKHTYAMGADKIDEETYNRELAKYRPLAKARGVCPEIQIVLTRGDDNDNE